MHISEVISKLLKALTPPLELKKNKEIEAENKGQIQKTLDNARDPANFPDPGLDAASFVTIDTTNMNHLTLMMLTVRYV